MDAPIVLAIDGGAGAGKGSAITNLAAKYQHRGHSAVALSSGAFYRAVAFLILRAFDAPFEAKQSAIMAMLKFSKLAVKDGQPVIYAGNWTRALSQDELYNDAVHHASSVFAKRPEIRAFVDNLICEYARSFTGILLTDGRDMTLVLGRLLDELGHSDNLMKVRLIVDDEEAARRRHTTVELIRERNTRDAEQTINDPDAFVLDTTSLDELQVTLTLDAYMCERFPELSRRLFIIYGPSGVGKATVIKRLRDYVPQLNLSRSLTTRPRRYGEAADAYSFVSREEFDARIVAGDLLERAIYGGNYYGTPRTEAERPWTLLEIDRQGAMIVREHAPNIQLIRLEPPGKTVFCQLVELRRRMGQAGPQQRRNNVRLRLTAAIDELSGDADLVVINDTVDNAARQIAAYI